MFRTLSKKMSHVQPRLATPAERPGADVVLYDGHCRFCIEQVRRLARWDTRGRLAFLSLHDPQVAERYPDLSHDELMRQMYIIDRLGRRYAGAAAFRQLSRRIPALAWLAPLLHLPGSLPLWQWCYRQVATHRYRFGRTADCENGSCAVHFR